VPKPICSFECTHTHTQHAREQKKKIERVAAKEQRKVCEYEDERRKIFLAMTSRTKSKVTIEAEKKRTQALREHRDREREQKEESVSDKYRRQLEKKDVLTQTDARLRRRNEQWLRFMKDHLAKKDRSQLHDMILRVNGLYAAVSNHFTQIHHKKFTARSTVADMLEAIEAASQSPSIRTRLYAEVPEYYSGGAGAEEEEEDQDEEANVTKQTYLLGESGADTKKEEDVESEKGGGGGREKKDVRSKKKRKGDAASGGGGLSTGSEEEADLTYDDPVLEAKRAIQLEEQKLASQRKNKSSLFGGMTLQELLTRSTNVRETRTGSGNTNVVSGNGEGKHADVRIHIDMAEVLAYLSGRSIETPGDLKKAPRTVWKRLAELGLDTEMLGALRESLQLPLTSEQSAALVKKTRSLAAESQLTNEVAIWESWIQAGDKLRLLVHLSVGPDVHESDLMIRNETDRQTRVAAQEGVRKRHGASRWLHRSPTFEVNATVVRYGIHGIVVEVDSDGFTWLPDAADRTFSFRYNSPVETVMNASSVPGVPLAVESTRKRTWNYVANTTIADADTNAFKMFGTARVAMCIIPPDDMLRTLIKTLNQPDQLVYVRKHVVDPPELPIDTVLYGHVIRPPSASSRTSRILSLPSSSSSSTTSSSSTSDTSSDLLRVRVDERVLAFRMPPGCSPFGTLDECSPCHTPELVSERTEEYNKSFVQYFLSLVPSVEQQIQLLRNDLDEHGIGTVVDIVKLIEGFI
jgi:hypothetical protein